MSVHAAVVPVETILPLREPYREEMACQIIHDSIHRRPGWTTACRLERDGDVAGYGLVAVAGPWTGNPTLFEFHLLPPHRPWMVELFDALVAVSGARSMEVQTREHALTAMLHVRARGIWCEKILFADARTTTYAVGNARLHGRTPEAEIREAIAARRGGGEWELEVDGEVAGKGGVLFHYNPPYGDVYMEVAEPFRRRGLGTWLVQELKRETRRLGQIPGARCNPDNLASLGTLLRAGFEPCGQILVGTLGDAPGTAVSPGSP